MGVFRHPARHALQGKANGKCQAWDNHLGRLQLSLISFQKQNFVSICAYFVIQAADSASSSVEKRVQAGEHPRRAVWCNGEERPPKFSFKSQRLPFVYK